MIAAVYERYGPPEVVQVREIATPAPGDRDVLIEVRATTVTSGDARMRAMNVPAGRRLLARAVVGLLAPRRRILGFELSGVVAAVGKDVRRFSPGDPIFGMAGVKMGLGCHAQYRVLPEDGALARKPAELSFEEAAAICFGGTTALDFFRRGRLRSGERVLVAGASGAVGTAAVQLAKQLGAHVTGVCSTANLELVRSVGADEVIDHTREDFTRSGGSWDVIMVTAGPTSFATCKSSLKQGGRLLVVFGALVDVFKAPWVNRFTDKRIIAEPASAGAEDVRRLGELAEAGRFRPVIDRVYPLERIADAHAYVDEGHKRGNVVITVGRAQEAPGQRPSFAARPRGA